jgi:hypothetical protein
MSDVETVRAAVLRRPAEARAALAAELIRSLNEAKDVTEDVDAAWAEEIQRRVVEVDAGLLMPVPWPDARRRILAAASGRREPR